jgi:hypothetical protein
MALLHPDSDLSLSLVFYGADVLRILRHSSKTLTVDDLLDKYLVSDSRRTPQSFFSTLDMLYATGVLEVKAYKVILTPQLSAPIQPFGRTRDLFDDFEADDA